MEFGVQCGRCHTPTRRYGTSGVRSSGFGVWDTIVLVVVLVLEWCSRSDPLAHPVLVRIEMQDQLPTFLCPIEIAPKKSFGHRKHPAHSSTRFGCGYALSASVVNLELRTPNPELLSMRTERVEYPSSIPISFSCGVAFGSLPSFCFPSLRFCIAKMCKS